MASDPHFDKVIALLKFEKANPTDFYGFRDLGPLNKNCTELVDGFLSDGPPVLFDPGVYVHDVNDMLQVGDSTSVVAANNFLAEDFTVEVWARMTTEPGGNVTIAAHWDSAVSLQWALRYIPASDAIQAFVSVNGSSLQIAQFNLGTDGNAGGSADLFDNEFHHFGIERSGTNIKVFFDGVMGSTVLDIGTDSLYAGRTKEFTLGGTWTGASIVTANFGAWFDSFRVTKGVARYGGADFTVPLESFFSPSGSCSGVASIIGV